MNTKLLMTISSLFLASAGVICLFAPAELATVLGLPSGAALSVVVQLAGALYLAFALTNWAAKGSMVGGVYSRPLSVGNFLHFMVGTLALLKYTLSQGLHVPGGIALAVYASFAALFTHLVFGHTPGGNAGQPKSP
jgi:hypothetical protein